MALKHDNPSKPRIDSKTRHEQWAHAPYNFIPLPDKVVYAKPPLDHDRYHHEEGVSGWIDLNIETCAPTYIRGMLALEEFRTQGQKKAEDLTEEDKEKRADFFATSQKKEEGHLVPVIPGSSLRGMIRSLIEIAGHGHMRWVADEPTFTFRAVANLSNDPLRGPYKKIIGNNASEVKAGYVEKSGDDWFIRPAITQKEAGWSSESDNQYVKVYDEDIEVEKLPGFKHFNDDGYLPQVREVSFKRGPRKEKTNWNKKGEPERPSLIVGTKEHNFSQDGMLVCAGNMLETAEEDEEKRQKRNQYSPRRKHVIVLPPINDDKQLLMIPPQAVRDYRAGLTPFQQEQLGAWTGGDWGCLSTGAPIFYVDESDGTVTYFGHSLNFRIPARLHGKRRAATPRDFVPDDLLEGENRPDLAEAIFGWVENNDGRKLSDQRAGRVYFTDAIYDGTNGPIWYSDEPIWLRTLSSPKPTTFQHYLAQNKDAGHDPDKKVRLAYYGTSRKETEIRGYKFYWHRGEEPPIRATDKELEHKKQLTMVRPINPGVRFSGRVHFENLRNEELGALLWALSLPGGEYRHKIGMGKPLGMGAIHIHKLELNIVNRELRYQRLLDTKEEQEAASSESFQWQEAESNGSIQTYLDHFEDFVIRGLGYDSKSKKLAALERNKLLLEMLRWREGDANWLEWTRYMEIEHERGNKKINEYKERPVLPTPTGFVKSWQENKQPVNFTDPQKTKQKKSKRKSEPKSGLPQPGDRIRGIVYEVDPDSGDVFFEIDGISSDDLMGCIHKENLAGRQYQAGHQTASCIVLEVKIQEGLVECKLKPK